MLKRQMKNRMRLKEATAIFLVTMLGSVVKSSTVWMKQKNFTEKRVIMSRRRSDWSVLDD